MAATSKQGTYLGTTLAGFTALPAGLVLTPTHAALGWVVAVAGFALLTLSAVGLYKQKLLEGK